MVSIIIRALKIALPYSVIATLVVQLVTMQSVVHPGGEGQLTVTGGSAIIHLIREFGLYSYIMVTLPQLVTLFLVVLVALIIQGSVAQRGRSNA